MRLRGRDLRAGLSGEDVAELQEELVRLGYAVPETERVQRLFGVGTAQAVAAFQTAHGMVDTAMVDKNTAAVLDRAATELPTTFLPTLPARPPAPPEPVVGRRPVPEPPPERPPVVPPERPPVVPPERPPVVPPERPPVVPPERPPVVPPERPPVVPPERPPTPERPPGPEPAAGRKLAGSLFADRGTPAAGVTLRFYAPGFGGKLTLVGEAVTGPDGSYTLDHDLPSGKGRLDVRAVGAGGKEIPLAGPADKVDPEAPVNVVIPAAQLPTPDAEYARLVADLGPHLAGGKLSDAKEDDQQRDLSLLHEATGWDARLIALGATAERLATSTGVAPTVAYGLIRAGLPTDPVQLARVGPAGVGHALRKAVQAGVVALNEQEIAAAQSKLDAFGRATRRKLAINGTASSYGSMLKATGLNDAQQSRFDEIFSAHAGDATTLWQRAQRADLPADQLKLTAQLGALTLNSARLTESLRAEVGSTGRLPGTLVAGKLYQPAAWQDRIRALANGNDRVLDQLIPPAYQAETVEERLQAYTADLAFKVRRSYPTQVLSDRIRSGELPLATTALSRDVATVLDRAATTGFVPGQRSLHRFVTDRREALFAGISDQDGVTAELATLSRQYQITASDEALGVLQRHDLRSAFQVSAMPERVFMAQYASEFPTRAEAQLTWRRAQQVSAVTLNLVAATKQLDSSRLLPALAQQVELVGQTQAQLVRQFPTLESLFGSLDFCECQHCRSVLSPAAYLVDLLKFLDDAPASPASPYQALVERRPDLPHLPLTCQNTHTALPYIDIVNEILEFYLVHDQLTPEAAYDTGDASTEDLTAEPQNLLPAAYDLLRQARYPLTAPFDLWLATVRAFTGHFEVPFWELLETLRTSDELRPAGEYGLAAVAYERLGFSPAELDLLIAANPLAGWPARYGYPENANQAQWGELANARTLARRLGVTYHELVALLRTRFVNPPVPDPLVLSDPEEAEPCSWEQTTLRHAGGTAAAPIDFLLLNQFVRIWRRLGWSIEDTDQALLTFLPLDPDPRTGTGIGPATASALLGLSHLEHLARLLGAGRDGRRDLLALWTPLPDRRYAELFLTGTAQTRDPAFEGEPGTYLTAAGVLLADHREAVQAALRLTADDLGLILAAAGLDPATAPLTMATVSLLHRHALLARLLKLSVADLLVLRELSGLDPFTPLATGPVTDVGDDHPYQQTIRFVETVRAVAASGLATSELDYLLRHRFDPVGPHRSAAQPPLALARELAAEVRRIAAEHAVPADPLTFTDEALARALAQVLEPEVVSAFLAAWTGPDPLPDGVFQEHLRRRVIPGVGEVGFLVEADLDPLFDPPAGDQAADASRRARLAGALLPYVRLRLTRQAVLDAVAAERDADPALVEALLTNPTLVDDPAAAGTPLIAAYLAATAPGLTIEDGRVAGYLELPASGGYQLTVRCEAAGSQVELRFDHLPEPALVATSTADTLELTTELELRGGTPYGFTLQHTAGARVELWVRGQRLAATPVTGLVTYPRTEVDRLHRRHLLLAKVLRIAGVLGLAEVELRHFLTQPGDFNGLDLGALPTTLDTDPTAARARFAQLLRLAGYVRLRGELAAEPADLVGVFASARRRVPAGADPAAVADQLWTEAIARFAAIVRREPATVVQAAELLGMSAGVAGDTAAAVDLTQERGLARLWRVLALATRIGVDPPALGRWATPAPDAAVAQDVRDTVRATYPPEQWRRVAQPIFDRLRQQRRDALVAQVLRVTGYQRMEQLFEHFLVDPGTEPVVQTSRIRLAISSVQTFIQRCLLNLELDVAPSSINADYWEWMKRYRVWEANRKIFLWPENWLEPELRDDKTHLFTQLETALLESDLDQPAVEGAFFGYLRGLDQIARLDIRAIYVERRPDPDANVLHVVARTSNAPHAYFYRTWSRRSWSPWLPVTASIDGDHLAVVVWQGRVHLFWVMFVPQAEAAQQSSTQPAGQVGLNELAALRPVRKIDVQLYWSCFTPAGAGPGEWSDPALATADEPHIDVVDSTFDAAKVFIWADVLGDGSVSLSLIGQGAGQSFQVRSRHVPPEHSGGYREPLEPPYLTAGDQPLARSGQGRWRGSAPKFRVHVEGETVTDQGVVPCDITEDILGNVPGPYRLVIVPPPAKVAKSGKGKGTQTPNRPEDPFFFLDASNTFFVEPDWTEFSIGDGDQALAAQLPVWHEFDGPEYWADKPMAAAFPEQLGLVAPETVLGNTPIVKPDDLVTRPDAVIRFGDGLIGSGGLLADPGRLFRSGPHGAAGRTDASNRS
jgi:ABC toxin-like protein/neuraminidase-like protein/putative peptidoglycan binding protein/virulence plasmid A protein